jgi:F-type H+-transporting ATPase subunit delta
MSSGKTERVAKRYARALFDVCNPADFDKVEGQLKALSAAWSSSAELRDSMLNPRIANGVRLSIVDTVVASLGGYATEPVQRVVHTLVSLRKASIFIPLSDLFALFVAEYRKALSLDVVVASESQASSVEALKAQLSHALGGDVTLQVKSDPSLLGGLTIRLGDRYLDRSVAGSLQRMALQLGR